MDDRVSGTFLYDAELVGCLSLDNRFLDRDSFFKVDRVGMMLEQDTHLRRNVGYSSSVIL